MFSRSKPRQLDTEDELYDLALRALMRRAHSVSEMKKLLARRASNDLLVQLVMARLKEGGKLDDARYAAQFARQRTAIRKQGKYRIARDLRARGVPDQHIASALEANAAESDEATLVRQRIDRKLRLTRGPKSGEMIDDRRIASLYRSLLAAGFSSDVIRRELRRLTHAEVPDSAPSDD